MTQELRERNESDKNINRITTRFGFDMQLVTPVDDFEFPVFLCNLNANKDVELKIRKCV